MKIIFGDSHPGETPIDDPDGLKNSEIRTREELSRAEADGIRKVLRKYFGGDRITRSIAPFDFNWAKRLHGEMFEDIWEWAGRFRHRNFNIGTPFGQIQEQLVRLFDDLEYWNQTGMEPLEQATRLHHRSVQIHPFINGNGRWSRMLANIWLGLLDRPPILWPDVFDGRSSSIRGAYIAALKIADSGDIGPLLEMHRNHSDR